MHSMQREDHPVRNLMRVSSAVTPVQWMVVTFIVFSCIYILLSATLAVLLLLLARRRKPSEEWSELIVTEDKQPARDEHTYVVKTGRKTDRS
jgi:cytochrome bd ubiquinol oxidase subunit I